MLKFKVGDTIIFLAELDNNPGVLWGTIRKITRIGPEQELYRSYNVDVLVNTHNKKKGSTYQDVFWEKSQVEQESYLISEAPEDLKHNFIKVCFDDKQK